MHIMVFPHSTKINIGKLPDVDVVDGSLNLCHIETDKWHWANTFFDPGVWVPNGLSETQLSKYVQQTYHDDVSIPLFGRLL